MFHSDPHMRSMPPYVYNQTALVVTSKKASLTGPRPVLLATGHAFFQALSDTPHDDGWFFPLCVGPAILPNPSLGCLHTGAAEFLLIS